MMFSSDGNDCVNGDMFVMNQLNNNAKRLVKITLILAITVPLAGFMIAKQGLKALPFFIPPILYFMINHCEYYRFYRECKRYVREHGGTIFSQNYNYSAFSVNVEGINADISIHMGRPSFVTYSTVIEKNHSCKFTITPNDCYNKAVRFVEKKMEIVPDNNLVLDNTFVITENTISVKSIETLLLPVKQDLLDSLHRMGYPTINSDGDTLVLTVIYNFDDFRLSHNFKIIRAIRDGLRIAPFP